MILSIISISNYEQLLADWDSRQEDSVLNIKEAKIQKGANPLLTSQVEIPTVPNTFGTSSTYIPYFDRLDSSKSSEFELLDSHMEEMKEDNANN